MKTILPLLLAATAAAHAQQSTLGEGDSYAWSGNLGWIEGTPNRPNRPNTGDGFRFGETFCAGYLWSANTGWIHCGDGTPADQDQLRQCGKHRLRRKSLRHRRTLRPRLVRQLNVMNASSDFDKDGYSDLKEYIALTNPLSTSSFLRVTKVERAAPHNGTATALT